MTSRSMICHDVGELRQALAKLSPTARVLTIAPSFEGVELIEQKDGRILIAPIKEKPVRKGQ